MTQTQDMAPPASLSLDMFLWFPGTFLHLLLKCPDHLWCLWKPRLAVCLGRLWEVPHWGRKRKCTIFSEVTPKVQNGKSFFHLLTYGKLGVFSPRFAKIRWISQPIKILRAGHATSAPHVREGRRPSLNNTTQLPVIGRQHPVLPPMMSKCSSYFWLFSLISRALTSLLVRTDSSGPPAELRLSWYKVHQSKINQQTPIPPSLSQAGHWGSSRQVWTIGVGDISPKRGAEAMPSTKWC